MQTKQTSGKVAFCVALIAAACAYGVGLDLAPFSRTCTFTVSGYQGATALDGFPVLIRLSESISGFSYADCDANGADLRFTDATGELLPHEIDTWDTSGESSVWVKVPTLSGTATAVHLYYGVGDPTTLPAVNARDVWTKYITVVHGGTGLSDSSPKALAVANGGGVSATAGSGIVGGGVHKPTANTIGLNVPNPIKNNTLADKTRFSFSAWYRSAGAGTTSGTAIIAASKGTWGGTGYLLICEGGKYMSVAVQSTHQGTSGKGALVKDQWAHVAFSYVTTGSVNTYFDGTSVYSNASAKSLDDEGKNNWTVGGYAMTTHTSNFLGDMDEIRIYDGIASADWIKAEHDSVANASFAVAGAATANSAWDCAGRVLSARQTADGIRVTGTLARLASSASSVSVSLKWGVTTALEGGTVAAGELTAPGDFSATFPGTMAGTTYHFAFVLTPDQGNEVTTGVSTFLNSGAGVLWRPQTANDTWNTASWQLGAQTTEFTAGWPVTFDGAEQNYVETITAPSAVETASMSVGGTKDYTLSGGPILADELVKTGSGTLKPKTAFAEPLNFDVREGVVAYDASFNFGSSAVAGTSTLVLGGGVNEARISSNKELCFARGAGSSADVTVKTNGMIVIDANSTWLRFGAEPGANCTVVVEKGGYLESGMLMFGSQGANCTARVAGTVVVRQYPLGVGEGSNTSLVLEPGGRIKARGMQMWNNSPTWSGHTGQSTLHVHDGVLELYPVASYATTSPILNTALHVTYEDAITFDIPSGGASYVLAALTNVTENGTAHLVKTGGGDLTVSGDLGGISGEIDVLAGCLTFTKFFAADADVTINVAEGAYVSGDIVGGAENILKFISKDSRGTLVLHGNNANETIDLSEYPNLKLAIWNGSGFNGKIIPYGNHYVFDMFGQTGVLNTPVADTNGIPARITITDSVGGGVMTLAADNSEMSGPIEVSGDVSLRLAHAHAAGTGNVTLGEGVSIELAAAVGANFLQTHVTADSNPAFVFISAGGEGCNVDLSRFPNCRLGTIGNVSITQTGTVAPRDGEYTLGGGNTTYTSSYTGLKPGVLADVGGATAVVVDRPGLVNLSNSANTYSGGTVITNAGRVFVAGADGFGAVPAVFDARNIVVDGGVVRQGNANTTLNAKRGIWVGENGMTLHAWGGYTLTVPGGLGGTGAFTITDSGHLSLTGPANTYNGAFKVSNAGTIFTIGGADAFSWASTGGISSPGTVVLNTPNDATFSDVVSGTGALKKQGAGTLTLAQAQTLTGATTVEAGTLRLATSGLLASTASINNKSDIFVDFAGSATDAFGNAPIYGPGTVRFAGGSNTTIDRPVPGVDELSAENGATLDYKVAGSVPVTVEDATLALYGTGAGTAVSGFSDFKLNGTATLIDDNELQLTPAETYKGASAFWRKRVSVTRPWVASFTYKTVDVPNSPADGFTFFLHNGASALDALGATGGALGVSGITPSVGAAYNIHQTDSAGWISNGSKTGLNTALGGISIQGGVDVCVTYDGEGTLVQHIYSGNKFVAFTNNVNLLTALGASTAWIGFSGATGGSVCDQRITNFRFSQADTAAGVFDISPSNETSKWRIIQNAVYEPIDGKPAFRVTDSTTYQTGAVTRLERVYVGAPFKIRGTYHFTHPASGSSADGAAVFLHVNSPMIVAEGGGSLGVAGTGHNNAKFTTAVGWAIKLHKVSAIAPIKNGAIGTAVTSLNGVNQKNTHPMDFVVSYTPGRLSITVTQDGNTATFSQDVDLAQAFGEKFAWLSFSGGTGAAVARQYLYDLSLEYETGDSSGAAGYGDVTFKGNDALRVAAGANDAVEVRTVTFADNAAVSVSASGASNQPYTLRADRIEFDVTGADAAPSISLAANGTAAGTLEIGTVAYGASPSMLKITGAVSGINGGKIRIEMPVFSGRVPLLDLTDATGISLEGFELVTETKPPVVLRLTNGILSAIHNTGTYIIVR
ncbi:MAG: DUF2341 domain-containing protein [Kiritimatiellae bacterium]|nr:DUF2341 domain-containing protein [Kiritimatiellia bacterium]